MFDQEANEDAKTIVCLHSSGSTGGQWRELREYIGDDYNVITPNLIGYGDELFAHDDALCIEHEVEAIVELIGKQDGKVHLVGHSYGGAIATHIAIWYPELVASLTVYEPVLLSMLYEDNDESPEVEEVEAVAKSIVDQIDSKHGRWRGARDFINYWSGADAWQSMADRQHARFANLMPKVGAEFDALIKVGTSATSLASLRMPVRVFCGAQTRSSARRVAELFAEYAPGIRLRLLEGLGHMAPVTHADVVNPLLVEHIFGRPRRTIDRIPCAT
jgi:pimeloyl-ACP methyl ester carboxylesterase